MIDIKFRAWHKELAHMYDVTYMSWNNGKLFDIFLENTVVPVSPDSVRIMQYTGLQDKNGKDIYVDDVVCFEYAPNYEQWDEGEKVEEFYGIIHFTYNGAIIMPLRSGCVFLLSSVTDPEIPDERIGNTLKIIGNQWENPDLLLRKST